MLVRAEKVHGEIRRAQMRDEVRVSGDDPWKRSLLT